uniref:Uncharacterized protein n=1 Tax=Polysiphonia sp. TaxID=1967842 RepID=A0A1Z1M3P2_9FLOR|nr:hypothetical protein [Polysiphonia sp.]
MNKNYMLYLQKENLYYKQHVKKLSDQDTYLPVKIDTKFQNKHYPFIDNIDNRKITISIQIKLINGEPLFFLHQDIKVFFSGYYKYLSISEDFCVFDLFKYHNIVFKHLEKPEHECKKLFIDLYGFFIVADVMKIFKTNRIL